MQQLASWLDGSIDLPSIANDASPLTDAPAVKRPRLAALSPQELQTLARRWASSVCTALEHAQGQDDLLVPLSVVVDVASRVTDARAASESSHLCSALWGSVAAPATCALIVALSPHGAPPSVPLSCLTADFALASLHAPTVACGGSSVRALVWALCARLPPPALARLALHLRARWDAVSTAERAHRRIDTPAGDSSDSGDNVVTNDSDSSDSDWAGDGDDGSDARGGGSGSGGTPSSGPTRWLLAARTHAPTALAAQATALALSLRLKRSGADGQAEPDSAAGADSERGAVLTAVSAFAGAVSRLLLPAPHPPAAAVSAVALAVTACTAAMASASLAALGFAPESVVAPPRVLEPLLTAALACLRRARRCSSSSNSSSTSSSQSYYAGYRLRCGLRCGRCSAGAAARAVEALLAVREVAAALQTALGACWHRPEVPTPLKMKMRRAVPALERAVGASCVPPLTVTLALELCASALRSQPRIDAGVAAGADAGIGAGTATNIGANGDAGVLCVGACVGVCAPDMCDKRKQQGLSSLSQALPLWPGCPVGWLWAPRRRERPVVAAALAAVLRFGDAVSIPQRPIVEAAVLRAGVCGVCLRVLRVAAAPGAHAEAVVWSQAPADAATAAAGARTLAALASAAVAAAPAASEAAAEADADVEAAAGGFWVAALLPPCESAVATAGGLAAAASAAGAAAAADRLRAAADAAQATYARAADALCKLAETLERGALTAAAVGAFGCELDEDEDEGAE